MAPAEAVVRIAGAHEVDQIARLRSQWHPDAPEEPDFADHLAEWLQAEGDRRTTWLAWLGDAPVGMASLLEYRRMPRPGRLDSRWGYVGNMFVVEDERDRGIGSALLTAIIE